MQRRYNNLFFRIYYSFFSRNFYRYVALKQKRNGIRFLFYIIVLIWLIPSCLIYLKINNLTFEQTDNPIIKKLDFIISQIPDLEFKNNELVLREDQQQHFEIKDGIYDKNLLVIDLDASSLITSNAVIILSKEGIYFNELEFMLRVVNYLGIKSERLNIDISGQSKFKKYFTNDDFIMNEKMLKAWLEFAAQNLKKMIFLTFLPLMILTNFIYKILQIFIFTILTTLIANSKKIKLSPSKILRLTIVAFIPGLIFYGINIITFWESYILNHKILGVLFAIAINCYFIHFAVISQKNKIN